MFSGGSVLVALSGGGDSVALLQLLVSLGDDLGITIEAAHLNHALREEEADRDELFCKNLCAELDIPITIERLRAGEIEERKGSAETVARELRQAFLHRTASDRKSTRIATGHTLDDLAETVLQRILRGTGPSGLYGIMPVRDSFWVRPLLCVTRSEVRDYLRLEGISYCEDTTNLDLIHVRNRIRHELMPFLQDRFTPQISTVLSRLAELTRIQETYLDEKVHEALDCCVIHQDAYKILLDKQAFLGYHKMIQQRVVRCCLQILEGRGRDADSDEIARILDLSVSKSGTIDVTSRVKCGVEESFAFFAVNIECSPHPQPLKLSGETMIPLGGGRIVSQKASGREKVDGRRSVFVDPELIKKYGNMTVGFVKPGDTITPFGTKKTVKIVKLFSSISLPKIFRNFVPIVRAGAVPLWIPGLKSSESLRFDLERTKPGTVILLTFDNGIEWF